jgi:transcriptional regulator with GAF, ATPase, and Fis domain
VQSKQAVEGHRRAIWALGAVLLGAMCVALVLLTWSSTPEGGAGVAIESRWSALVGLCGLVALFLLYTARQQRELSKLERRLRDLAVREASLQARLGELSFLFDTSTQLQLRLDLQGMIDLAVQRLVPCLEAQQASILLFNEAAGLLEVRGASGVDAELVAGQTVVPGEGIAGKVYRTGETMVLTSDAMRRRFPDEIKKGRVIDSSVLVPMRSRGRTIGVMCVARGAGTEPFDETHARMLESFAEHCAAGILKIHHHQILLEGVKRTA